MAGVDMADFKNLLKVSKILKHLPGNVSAKDLFNYLLCSQSEIDQELIAFILIGKGGYFVEFGACNGIIGSNTYFLEKYQGWQGVLAEPIPEWFGEIKKNRSSKAFQYAIYPLTGKKIDFIETDQRGLSTLSGYEHTDRHGEKRISGERGGKTYQVETITLQQLLIKASAPKQIDFLSIDTEGSEFEILSNFPFEEYVFKFITVEHNNSENRDKLKVLMNSKGYFEIFPEFSGGDWWFVPKDTL
jgi:FkbM family methyltransferase